MICFCMCLFETFLCVNECICMFTGGQDSKKINVNLHKMFVLFCFFVVVFINLFIFTFGNALSYSYSFNYT